MKYHTYSLLMALIRLGKGALSACESWVVKEAEGAGITKRKPAVTDNTSEG